MQKRVNRLVAVFLLVCHFPALAETTSNQTAGNQITVLTLNIAHGRSDGPNQLLQRSKAIRANLNQIAGLLRRVSPDIVALQEADGPSFWSGRFDHVEYLAERAGYPFYARGIHMKIAKVDYGTALLSKYPLPWKRSVQFPNTPPTPRKGFLVSEVAWQSPVAGDYQPPLTVVSLHLDFARRAARKKQIHHLMEYVNSVEGPLIIMGDFNCDGVRPRATLKLLMKGLDLQAYRPKARDLATYPSTGKRLDWILISRDLKFISYKVLPKRVSDHLAVLATIAYQPEPAIRITKHSPH